MDMPFFGHPEMAKLVPPICIHCDDQLAIGWIQSQMYNDKFKHIRHRHNIIKQTLSIEIITLEYAKSNDNLVDPLIKR